ncbi:MAG: HD-GYP domain-containing protein [Bryobacteraceae bacterium]
MTLAARVFLWMVVPMGSLLLAGFMAAGYTVEERVTEQLRSAQRESEQRLRQLREGFDERSRRLLATLAENPSLKAGIGLSRAGLPDEDVRRTVEDQLRELTGSLDLGFVCVMDSMGRPLAAMLHEELGWLPLDPASVKAPDAGLMEIDGRLFTVTTVPVNIGEENLGRLSAASEFLLDNFSARTAVLRGSRVVRSNLPPEAEAELKNVLGSCGPSAECRVVLAGERYLSLPVEEPALQGPYRVRMFESLDAAGAPWKSSLRAVFGVTGLLALVAAIAVAGFASRSVAAPINALIGELRVSERIAAMPAGFATSAATARSAALEVRELAAAFNRAAKAVADSRERLEEAHLEFIMAMAHALDARDLYTAGHSRRVSEYSCAIARKMGLPQAAIADIRIGALLHDIGKLGVPDAILQKPGRLTEEETELVRQHPVIGVEILAEVRGFEKYWPIVELHHENPDGTGYPRGLKDGEIPVEVAIVHVADAYDAMTSDRPYRVGLTHEVACDILSRNAGTQFDERIVGAFLELPAPVKEAAEPAPETALSQLSLSVESNGAWADPRT